MHRKVLMAIMRCRTGELGDVIYQCKSCSTGHWVGRSCGNRHCPNCQKEKTQDWLDAQTQKLLPIEHFVVTFTVPSELRLLLRKNQKAGYDAIFKAGSETIRTLLGKDKNLGSDKTGFFGVLHTWGRDPKDYHPHVHFVLPGGGVSRDDAKWLQVSAGKLFHPLPAKRLYKKLFAEEMRRAGLYNQMPRGVLKREWVVNTKPVGNGQAVLKYLAPYVYRVALSDNRIESVNPLGVTYKIKPSGQDRWVMRQAKGEQFVRSFVQHILPRGFQKVRYYGWMSPNCKLQLADVRWLVWLWLGWTFWLGLLFSFRQPRKRPRPKCRRCGGELELMRITNQNGTTIWPRRSSSSLPPSASALPARGPPRQ